MTGKALKIIRDVHQLFIEKGLRLSVAESCTGGLISHYLTWLSGASKFFEAGVVSYSVSAKVNIPGVCSWAALSSLRFLIDEISEQKQ